MGGVGGGGKACRRRLREGERTEGRVRERGMSGKEERVSQKRSLEELTEGAAAKRRRRKKRRRMWVSVPLRCLALFPLDCGGRRRTRRMRRRKRPFFSLPVFLRFN